MTRHTLPVLVAALLCQFVAVCEGNCSGALSYEACGRCWTDPAQARSGGCTTPSANRAKKKRNRNSSGGGGGGGCSGSHSHFACGRCWASAAQASYGGCTSGGQQSASNNNNNNRNNNNNNNNNNNSRNNNNNNNNNNNSNNNRNNNNNNNNNNNAAPSTCGQYTYNPQNTNIVSNVQGNANAGGFNSDGLFVSVKGVVSNPCNTVEAIKDIERNLGIDIDDEFVAQSGYQGNVPPLNPKISKRDFITYMKALFRGVNKNGQSGDQYATEFANRLDTNGDGILERNEASMAKGADPRQVLNLEPLFTINGGLATDDVMAYVGLYLGDGALDKYAGDMPKDIQDNMNSFTRTWQPSVSNAGWSN